MAAEIAIPAAAKEKLVTMGSAFGTGVAMSFVVKKWPAAGIIGNIVAVGGGVLGSLVTKGWVAELAEGVGAGGAAILGSTIAWLPEAGAEKHLTTEIQKNGKKIQLQLNSGVAGATGEAEARAVKASVLEF